MSELQNRLKLPPAQWPNLSSPVSFSLEQEAVDYSGVRLVRLAEVLAAQLRSTKSSEKTPSVLLFHTNAYYFSSAFMALNALEYELILPASLQPLYLQELPIEPDFIIAQTSEFAALQTIYGLDENCFFDPSAIDAAAKGEPLGVLNLSAKISLFTSGSTAQPSRIEKTVAELINEIQVLDQQFSAIPSEALVFASVSHQHIYGLLFRLLWPLYRGLCFQDIAYTYPESVIQAIKLRAGLDVLVSSPAQLKRWAEHQAFAQIKGLLHTLFSSGGPLPGELAIRIAALIAVRPTEIYGSTETGGIAWRQQTDTVNAVAWQLFEGVEIQLADDQLLQLRSNYIHKSLLNASGYYVSSDRVSLNVHGGFELLGRNDRVIKLEEKRLSLDHLESTLAQHELVMQARALLDSSQDQHRDTLLIVVALSGEGFEQLIHCGKSALSKALKQYLSGYFEAVLLPRKWRFCRHLPQNINGKTTQLELRQLFDFDIDTVVSQQHYPALAPRQNDFAQLQLLSKDDDAIVISIRLPAEDDIFTAHFPQFAVLPGLMQIDYVMQLAKLWFRSEQYIGMRRLKFKSPMLPGSSLVLRCDLMKNNKAGQAGITFSYGAYRNGVLTEMSSGRLIFKLDDEEADQHV